VPVSSPIEGADDAECSAWNAGDGAGGVRCRWARDGVPMSAHSPSSVAESASRTGDPDAQARRGNEGEPSAGFPSDLTIDDGAVDGLVTAEECAAEFDEHLDDGTLYAKYRRLAAEQAAFRRLATLVARGVEPVEVFGAVADEMRRCLPADTAGLWRFESDREITLVAAAADPEALARWPVGTRTPIAGNALATRVHRSGRPARIDSYDNVAGPIAARVRAVGVRAAVAVPIIVDGHVLPGGGRFPAPRPDASRHRGPHQPLRRTRSPLLWWPVIATSRTGSSWLRRQDGRI
jgi:GAF domain